VAAEGRADDQNGPGSEDDDAGSVDAHDLCRCHRLRTTGSRSEGSAESGHRDVPRPDVSNEMIASVHARIARLLVAGGLLAAASGAAQPPAGDTPMTLQAVLDQA